MLKAVRAALVSLATVSTTLLAGPAFAGMVSTPAPKATTATRAGSEGMEILKQVGRQAGITPEQIEKAFADMPAAQRDMLASQAISVQAAGNLIGIIGVVVAVILGAIIVISELLWSKSHLTDYNR